METIFIENLIIEGKHGVTAKERSKFQRFRIDINVNANSNAHRTDKISDVFDYRIARNIITEVIGSEKFNTIEKIAERIAEKVLETPKANLLTLTIRKADIWNNGTPGITVTREKIPQHINLLDFDLKSVVENIASFGGMSLPILSKKRRLALLSEAEKFSYAPQPEIIGNGKVREQLSSFIDFPTDSLFWQLKNDFTELMIRKLSLLGIPNLFTIPLEFNDASLQKYNNGSIGITPHRDGKSRINIIPVFILSGKSKFAICRDRSGSDPIFLDTTPGNVIIIRGPGFFGSTYQPFHFVTDITEERIVFGLRQRTRSSKRKGG